MNARSYMKRSLTMVIALLAGCMTGGSGGGGSGDHGGARVGEAFFAGGRAPAPSGGVVAGMSGDENTCTNACVGLIGCVTSVCEVELTARQTRNGEAACVYTCDAEAVDDEIEAAIEGADAGCAGFTQVAAEEALCDGLAAEDFDAEPSTPARSPGENGGGAQGGSQDPTAPGEIGVGGGGRDDQGS